MIKDPASVSVGPKNNFTATVIPTVSNDSSEGYSIGSRWINNTTKKIYDCFDVSIGAADWQESGGGGGGGGSGPAISELFANADLGLGTVNIFGFKAQFEPDPNLLEYFSSISSWSVISSSISVESGLTITDPNGIIGSATLNDSGIYRNLNVTAGGGSGSATIEFTWNTVQVTVSLTKL